MSAEAWGTSKDRAIAAWNSRPNQEATRTVGDEVIERAIEWLLPHAGDVEAACLIDDLRALTAKPDPEAVTRMELVEALNDVRRGWSNLAEALELEGKDSSIAETYIEEIDALLTKATRPASPDA